MRNGSTRSVDRWQAPAIRGRVILTATPSRAAWRSDLPLSGGGKICIAGISLVADTAGALYWPAQGLLTVADLHLEKASSFAAGGVLLPPYDSTATLLRLAHLIARYAPRCVVALGDSFHDSDGPMRLLRSDREVLSGLQRGREWIWVSGNHDPEPPSGIGGKSFRMLTIGGLTLRHEPTGAKAEIAGHLHPVARIRHRGRSVSRRCFASDGTRLVMPAFGTFAGGLNVRNIAFAKVFGTLAFTAHLLGEDRLYTFAARRCLPD